MKWPWRQWRPQRRPDRPNGRAAAAAERAEKKLASTRAGRHAVQREIDKFSAVVEQAMRGAR